MFSTTFVPSRIMFNLLKHDLTINYTFNFSIDPSPKINSIEKVIYIHTHTSNFDPNYPKVSLCRSFFNECIKT